MRKKLLFVSLIAAYSVNLFSQSELPEYVKDPAKVYKDAWYDFPKEGRTSKNGGGYSVSMKLLTAPPKKVALVSFFTFDPGCTKSYSYSSTSGYITTTTTVRKQRNSQGNAGPIAAGIYNTAIDPLIEKFKSYGMDLLLPEQYLDTEEKIEYYNKFEVGHGGFQYGFNNFLSAGSTKNDIYGYVEGYNVMDVVAEQQANFQKSGMLSTMGYSNKVYDKQVYYMNKDEAFRNSMGYDLATKLGVDAVMFVYFTIYVPKESKIKLLNANMIIFGPNPLQVGENEKAPMFYSKGVFYCGARVSPDVAIVDINKKVPDSNQLNFTGFDVLMLALADKIGLYLTGKED